VRRESVKEERRGGEQKKDAPSGTEPRVCRAVTHTLGDELEGSAVVLNRFRKPKVRKKQERTHHRRPPQRLQTRHAIWVRAPIDPRHLHHPREIRMGVDPGDPQAEPYDAHVHP
jgi:hypothetical protein